MTGIYLHMHHQIKEPQGHLVLRMQALGTTIDLVTVCPVTGPEFKTSVSDPLSSSFSSAIISGVLARKTRRVLILHDKLTKVQDFPSALDNIEDKPTKDPTPIQSMREG